MLQALPGGEQAKQLFKRRMMSSILATDMARHMTDLNEIKEFIAGLKEGDSLIEQTDMDTENREQIVEKNKQRFLDLAVHASDVSFLCRKLNV